MPLLTSFLHLSPTTIILLLSIFILTPPPTTASAVALPISACAIPLTSTSTSTTTISFPRSPSTTLSNPLALPAPASTTISTTSTTALWQIDPQCLPGVAQCHPFNDRFRYCDATGYWIPNYCGGDWVCCAWSTRNGAGPMCESREMCEVWGRPDMAAVGEVW